MVALSVLSRKHDPRDIQAAAAAAKALDPSAWNPAALRDEAVGGGYVTNEEFDVLVDPSKMISPG